MTTADCRLAHCVALYQGRDLAAAEDALRQLLPEFPDDGRFWQLYGIIRWQRGDLKTARFALETASCLRPLAPLARCALAHAYLHLGPIEVARFLYLSLAEDERTPTALLPKVATGLGCLREEDAALQVCVRLARCEPRHHAAFFGMAYYMARLDYPAASILDPLAKAHNLAPRIVIYRLNLALLYAELGRDAEAYLLLCEIEPNDVPAAFPVERLLALFAAVGDEARLRAFRRCLKRGFLQT